MLNIEDKKIEIIEKAVVTYINGNIDFFEAIYISDKKIIIGKIVNDIFVESGGIPKKNIKKIDGEKKLQFIKKSD